MQLPAIMSVFRYLASRNRQMPVRCQISVGKGFVGRSRARPGNGPAVRIVHRNSLYFLAGSPPAGAPSAAFGSGTGLSAKVCK
jgi:hypothetical protein